MNRIYRSIWNDKTGTYVAVAETAKAAGNRTSGSSGGIGGVRFALKTLAVAVALSFGGAAHANPSGAQVANGQVGFNQQGGVLTVTNTPGAIINWQSFSIGGNETTRFIQQSAASAVLNRVVGQDPSAILGSLQSNGRVFLINPNGILFGQGSQINVAGLVASTLNLSDSDFLANRLNFTANALAKGILNQGSITTESGGNVYLVAPDVQNSGIITTPQGEVVLAAGRSVQLMDAGTPDLRVEITAPGDQAVNVGQIVAAGGRINMYGALVSQQGILNASSAVAAGGRIFLRATRKIELTDGSQTRADGTQGGEIIAKVEDAGQISGALVARGELSAQGDGTKGSGGFVETSAGRVDLNGVSVKTRGGRWLIDPNDFTIAATGGDITGAQLSSNLNGNDVAIESTSGATAGNGDINVNDAVTWNTYSLILNAERDININAVMKANNAGLVMNTGVVGGVVGAASGTVKVGFAADGSFKGRVDFFQADGTTARSGTGFLNINGVYYDVITDVSALQAMSADLTGHYALGANIDASATSGWNSGAGFAPIGNSTRFSGNFDGLGHSISDLTINRPSENYVGLFGYLQDAVGAPRSAVRNVGLVRESVVGGNIVGGLVGQNDGNLIGNSYVTGSVTGISNVGGLVGISYSRPINNSYATGTVTGTGNFVGGLVGSNGGVISNSYADVAMVTGSSYAGGLVGNPGGLSTSSNVHYNIDTAGLGMVGAGGLYGTQFQDWVGGNLAPLDIAHYYTANASGFYQIADTQGLKNLLGFADTANPAYKFVLTANLDLSTLPGYTIPLFAAPQLDGAGHTLDKFTLNAPTANDVVGFIGKLASGSKVSNLGLTNVNVTGHNNVGALVGFNYGTIENSFATGAVTGSSYVGGLVGFNSYGSIGNSYAAGTVSGGSYVGGLLGANMGTVGNSHATADVTGSRDVGGLVGFNRLGSIVGSHAEGNVTGGDASASVGGLVGKNESSGTIDGSYAIGNVQVGAYSGSAGGLVGLNNGHIGTSHATGSVTGLDSTSSSGSYGIGGLVGSNYGAVIDSYATGPVRGGSYNKGVGGLVGLNYGSIAGSHAEGNVTGGDGSDSVGGLVGRNEYSAIDGSYAIGNVTVGAYSNNVGGLVGLNNGHIGTSHASGSVTGLDSTSGRGSYGIGGLVGANYGEVIDSYATGNVTGGSYNHNLGGLVGGNYGSISRSYATGRVQGGLNSNNVGGLVGANYGNTFYGTPGYGTIADSYATGAVTGGANNSNVGGLVGGNFGDHGNYGSITNSYATGTVTGGSASSNVGGLVGHNSGPTASITASFWNSDANPALPGIGLEDGGAVTDATTAGLSGSSWTRMSTFAGWDIANTPGSTAVWRIYEGNTAPLLRSFLTPLTVTANDATKTYDGLAYDGSAGVSYSVAAPDMTKLSGTLSYTGGIDAGTYAIAASGLYSSQQGYDISYVAGTLTVNPPAPPTPPAPPVTGIASDPGVSAIVTALNVVKPADTQNTTQLGSSNSASDALGKTAEPAANASPEPASGTTSGTTSESSSGAASKSSSDTASDSKQDESQKSDTKPAAKKPLGTCS